MRAGGSASRPLISPGGWELHLQTPVTVPRGRFLAPRLHTMACKETIGLKLELKNYGKFAPIIKKNCVLGPWRWPRPFLSLTSRGSILKNVVLGLEFF